MIAGGSSSLTSSEAGSFSAASTSSIGSRVIISGSSMFSGSGKSSEVRGLSTSVSSAFEVSVSSAEEKGTRF